MTFRRGVIAVLLGAGVLYLVAISTNAVSSPSAVDPTSAAPFLFLFSAPDDPGDSPEEANSTGIRLRNLSLPPGLGALSGIVDQRLDWCLVVQVVQDGRPVAGRRVTFLVLVTPPGATGHQLSALEGVTDAGGRATTEFVVGSKVGLYVVGAFLDDGLVVDPIRIRVDARTGGWWVFLVFGLLGGLGLFLMGMQMSGDGLKEAAGARMRGVLSALTSNRVLGLLIGVVATAVLQSSSASTVMLVGFVSAAMMTLTQAISVTMGAKIGTTITAQLIAFNLSEYSLALVALGFIFRIVGKGKGVRQAGTIVLGFGLIFFGLGVMGDAMRPLRTVPAFTELLVSLGEQPLLGILVATAFTAIVQSSAATIGLAIALCASGLLSLEAALPLAWGAHVGTCATALLSSLGTSREGKQVAVSHLIFSVVSVAVAFPFLGYFVEAAQWMTAAMGSTSPARELANGHMLFTVATGILFLPLVRQLAWLTRKIVPPARVEPPFGPVFLAETALEIPVLALEQAHREILRMAGIVRSQMGRVMNVLETPDEETAEAIIRDDEKVDILERAIRPFLARVAQSGLEPGLIAREHGLIYVVQDLEGIGDIVTKELAVAGRRLGEKGLSFSEEGLSELRAYHEKLCNKFDRVVNAIGTFDRALAEVTLQLGFKERMMERKLRDAHLERLHGGREETVATSTLHFSVLNNLRAVGERLDNIARTMIEEM